MTYTYDDQNVFAKILRGEIPNKTVKETEHTLAFHDIAPQTPTHVLVVPKTPCVTFDDFIAKATEPAILDFFRVVADLTKELGVSEAGGGEGYRLICNAGPNGHQEVPHFHMHIVAGKPLGHQLPNVSK